MNSFRLFHPADLSAYYSKREGETRLGERISTLGSWEALPAHPAPVVVLGIPEDIGVRANFGIGGTPSAWPSFLKSFLGTQAPAYAAQLLLLGAFDFSDLNEQAKDRSAVSLRELVEEIDRRVAPVLERIFSCGKTTIVIGGGHNNAYPIIKALRSATGSSVGVLNLDAHSDCRPMEGRHSGNPFRYAIEEGLLDRYRAFGLHRPYNAPAVLDWMSGHPAVDYCFYEDVMIDAPEDFRTLFASYLNDLETGSVGFELDLDCIERVLSSAATPCGLGTVQARQATALAARHPSVRYAHFPEGSCTLDDGRTDASTGKLLSYLVHDFTQNRFAANPR